MKTYYSLLKVERNSTTEEIKSAYRALASRYHPDVNKGPEAGEIFKVVNRAYLVLSNPAKRQDYDNLISTGNIIRVRSDDQVLETSSLATAISNIVAVTIVYSGLAVGIGAFSQWLVEAKKIFWSQETINSLVLGALLGVLIGFNSNFSAREIFGKRFIYYRIIFWLIIFACLAGLIYINYTLLQNIF